jgi:hypothetical protein
LAVFFEDLSGEAAVRLFRRGHGLFVVAEAVLETGQQAVPILDIFKDYY